MTDQVGVEPDPTDPRAASPIVDGVWTTQPEQSPLWGLRVGVHPWDHGVATWWDYDWRAIASDYPERSAPRQVFTRLAEAVEGLEPRP